ncbi:MAG: dihydroneopterin aldolase [Oleiphilus sp.]
MMINLDATQSDIVLIDNLALEASIGVFDWEKKVKQVLQFDLELCCDFTKAAQSDDIDDAVNYAQVCEEVAEVLGRQHYQLLEYLAEQICQHLFQAFPVSAISLSIHKPNAVPKTSRVGVRVIRQRPEHVHFVSKTNSES